VTVWARRTLIGSAAAVFVLVCVLPAAYMVYDSLFSADGSLTISNYSRLVSESRQRELLLTSITLGAGAAAIATILGVPLGFVLARARVPRLFRLALLVPLVIPPYVLALIWIFMTGYSATSYSLGGAALVLGIGFFPLSMLASEAGFRRVDASLEEAGSMVANPLQVFLRITLPLVAPLIAAAALLVFALSVAEFGVPGLLRVRVFTTEVFTAFAALYDFGRATALAAPLLAVTVVAAVMARFAVGDRLLTPNTTWRPAAALTRKWNRVAISLVLAVVAMTVVLPVGVLVASSQRVIESAAPSWTAIRWSIFLSIVAASIIVIVAVLLGYTRGRMQSFGGIAVDLLLIAAFAMPSTVIGVGIIGVWNRQGIPGGVYASATTVVLGYMARFLPVAVLILAASVRQVPVSSEEAAEISGVGWTKMFWRIVLPQITGGIVVAWVAVFVFTFGELGTTILVSPPGESTLPVRVYTMIANARRGEIAALALLQVLATITPLALLVLTLHRTETRT